MKQKGIMVVQKNDSYEVQIPGFQGHLLAEYIVYFTPAKGGHIITTQNPGETFFRIGKLNNDILQAEPEIVSTGMDDAREVARIRASGLAQKLSKKTKLPIVYS